MFSNISFIDLFPILLFLLATIYVSIKVIQREKKTTDFRYYALGGQNFNTTTLTSTIIATWSSGVTVFIVIENTYSSGLNFFIPYLGIPLSLFLSGYIIIRMHKFINAISVADALGNIYGNTVRVFIAFFGILARIGNIASQTRVLATTFMLLFGFNSKMITIITMLMIIAYTISGGMRTVVFTDVLQFIVFGVFLYLLSLKIFYHAFGYHYQDQAQSSFSFYSWSRSTLPNNLAEWKSLFNLVLYYTFPILFHPEIFQRISLAGSVEKAQKAFQISSFIFLMICLVLGWMGMTLWQSNSNLSKTEVMSYFVNYYLAEGSKGLFMICILALVMSTVDSMLHSSSVLFVHDIAQVFFKKINPIKLAKYYICFIGTICFFFAISEQDMVPLLRIFSGMYQAPACIPILFTFLGFRTQPIVVLTTMLIGFFGFILWCYFYEVASSFFPLLSINFSIFFGMHYLLGFKGGWQKFTPETPLIRQRTDKMLKRFAFLRKFKQFNLLKYLQQSTPSKYELYFYFGLYMTVIDYFSLYTLPYTYNNPHFYQLCITTGVLVLLIPSLLVCPIWASKLDTKNPTPLILFWMTSLFLSFFSGIMLYILSGFQMMQLFFLILNIFILGFSTSLPLLFILFTLSATASFFCFYPTHIISLSHKEFFGMSFQLFGLVIVLSSLLRKVVSYRNETQDLKAKTHFLSRKMQQTILDLPGNKSQKLTISQLFSIVQTSNLYAIKYSKKNTDDNQKLHTLSKNFLSLISNMSSKKQQDPIIQKPHFNKAYIDLKELLVDIKKQLSIQHTKPIKINYYPINTQLYCDSNKIIGLLTSSISLIQNLYHGKSEVSLTVKPTFMRHEDKQSSTKIKEVPAIIFLIASDSSSYYFADYYTPTLKDFPIFVSTDENGNQICKNLDILEAHHSHYNIIEQEDDLMILYVIPINF